MRSPGPAVQDGLALSRVELYRNGVGYFEKDGQAGGQFPHAQGAQRPGERPLEEPDRHRQEQRASLERHLALGSPELAECGPGGLHQGQRRPCAHLVDFEGDSGEGYATARARILRKPKAAYNNRSSI